MHYQVLFGQLAVRRAWCNWLIREDLYSSLIQLADTESNGENC